MNWNRKVKKCGIPKGVFFIPDDSDQENFLLLFRYKDYNNILEQMEKVRPWCDHDNFIERNKLILVN